MLTIADNFCLVIPSHVTFICQLVRDMVLWRMEMLHRGGGRTVTAIIKLLILKEVLSCRKWIEWESELC